MTATAQDTEKHPTLRERAGNEAKHLVDSTGKIVLIDFLLGCVMVVFTYQVKGLPLAALAGFALVLIGITRKPQQSVPPMGIFIALMVLGLTWATFSSALLSQVEFFDIVRRIARITSVFLVVVFIADKRLDLRSIVLGLAAGSLVNVVAYYAGVAPDNYPGYLTGWFNDKNVAGLYYAMIAFLLFAVLKKRSHRIIALAIFSIILWETGSRTSMAALGFAVLWVLFAYRLNFFFKTFLAVGMVWTVNFLEENFAQVGVFSARAGSDALRGRIDAASQVKIDSAPWHGLGLSTAKVQLGEHGIFFFHNSFWTLLVEAGWIYLLLIMTATICAAFLFKQTGKKKRVLFGEGATILIFICSWRLGEVLLTMPWGLAMGLALSLCAVPLPDKRFNRYLESLNSSTKSEQ